MARTVTECLIPAAPCSECEERDCCRDERRVAQLRARVAELEREQNAQAERVSELEHKVEFYENREQHYAKVLSVADGGVYRNDWDAAIGRVVKDRDAAESRAIAAEQRVERLEGALRAVRESERRAVVEHMWAAVRSESWGDLSHLTKHRAVSECIADLATAIERGEHEPYCACGRRVSECDGSRAGCVGRAAGRERTEVSHG